jgi:hypothetical protein
VLHRSMQANVPERECHALQFLLFIKATTACEASACRATFARAAWTILK